MPRADFYIIDTDDPADRDRFACRYINRAYTAGSRVFVYARSEQQARELDDLLWRFRAESFVPHALAGDPDADPADYPVLIGHHAPPAGENGVLLNLSGALPDFHGRFERIAEIFNRSDQADLAAARQAFKVYRDAGYQPDHHEIEKV